MINQLLGKFTDAHFGIRLISLGLASIALLLGGCAENDGAVHGKNDAKFFATADSNYADIIQNSEKAFMARDAEGAIKDMADDYVLYDITDVGAVERLRGKETVRKVLPMILQSDKWVGSEVDRLALIENTLVQVEHDTYKNDDGTTRTVSTLVVFEHRDGKRWREWRYIPADR